MQIVIDIPQELKNLIDTDCLVSLGQPLSYGIMIKAIKNGIVLPKGHGRLADLDAALKCVEETADCDDKFYAMCLFDWAMSKRVVLEVDKEVNK